MLTQAIASLAVVVIFGGIFIFITLVRNNYMAKVNPKDCNGREEGLCASCPSICDSYRNDLYKEALTGIAHVDKNESTAEDLECEMRRALEEHEKNK